MKFLVCVLLVAVTAFELSNDLMRSISDLTPDQVKSSKEDFIWLRGEGLREKQMAIDNQTKMQKQYDDAYAAWERAEAAWKKDIGERETAEENEKAAEKAVADAIAFEAAKKATKEHAETWEAPAQKFMEDEIARVAEEKIALDKVVAILNKLIANGGKAAIDTGRSLLSASRTVALLTAPSFIASLEKADPTKLKEVLKIVLNLIQEGKDDVNSATAKYNDVMEKIRIATNEYKAAVDATIARKAELVDATKVKNVKLAEEEEARQHEVAMRAIRDKMLNLLDIQKAFTARVIARIDGETAILDEGINLQGQLHKVTQILA